MYAIGSDELARALEHYASQPLPDPKLVFPWMHGLHPDNQMQLTFFVQRRKALRKTPKCIRGITIVKAGGDMSHSKLKGAIAPEEIMCPRAFEDDEAAFLEIDPREGFSVRNFQIQACKMATVSDIVVYGDDDTSKEDVIEVAVAVARCQKAWMRKSLDAGDDCQPFNTFVVSGTLALDLNVKSNANRSRPLQDIRVRTQ